jgi:hypothetical protein
MESGVQRSYNVGLRVLLIVRGYGRLLGRFVRVHTPSSNIRRARPGNSVRASNTTAADTLDG